MGPLHEDRHQDVAGIHQWPFRRAGDILAFRLEPGYYFWDFTIDKDYVQPNRVCILASGTPGHSCFVFTYLS